MGSFSHTFLHWYSKWRCEKACAKCVAREGLLAEAEAECRMRHLPKETFGVRGRQVQGFLREVDSGSVGKKKR